MIGLTDRQAQALRFVAAYTDEQGYPPTLREIGDHLGIRSTNGVGEHLGRLEVKGMLKIKPVISRGIVLTPLGRAFVEKYPAPGVVVRPEPEPEPGRFRVEG